MHVSDQGPGEEMFSPNTFGDEIELNLCSRSRFTFVLLTCLHQEFASYSIRGARNKTRIVIGFALFLLVFVFVFSFVSDSVKGWVSLAL